VGAGQTALQSGLQVQPRGLMGCTVEYSDSGLVQPLKA
jgi:hypothetical protein